MRYKGKICAAGREWRLRYGNESLRWITIQRDTQFHDGRMEWHVKLRCTSTSTSPVIQGVEAQEWNYIYISFV